MTYYEIELPIILKSEEEYTLSDLGIDINSKLADNPIGAMTFYSINGISPYYDDRDNDKEYCRVFSNGESFIVNLTYKQVRELLSAMLQYAYGENEE